MLMRGMSDQPSERRRHFRGKPRPGRVLPVRFRVSGADWRTGETRNVGVGGAFIAGVTDVPVGTALELELSLPSCDHPLAMNAVVRRAGTANDSSDGELGIGVEFID